MSKKKISVENEEFITYRALLLSIDFVKKLVTEMSDEDLNKVKENFDIAIQQRDERKENMKAIKSLMNMVYLWKIFIVNLAKNHRQAEKVCQEGINTSMTITVKECTGMGKDVGLRP